MAVEIVVGDCIQSLRAMPAQSVHTCVTSPPYFGLRDYGHDGQIGLEQTPDEFVAKLVEVFREVKRVLRDDGTLFLNLGDSYCSANTNALLCLREDCSMEVARDVALAVFGVRIDGDEAQGQRALSEVLPGGGEGSALRRGPDVAGQGEQASIREEPGCGHPENNRQEPRNQGEGDRGARWQVRLLRGEASSVPDGGPHSRGRSRAQEGLNGQEPGLVDTNLSGHSEAGLPAGTVSGAMLELQLRDRVVRLLSARPVAERDIPPRLRAHFRQVGPKPKDLIGIPWRVAFALQADGWYLRQDIIWHKPNPMPESVRDRCTKAHEYIFLLSKSEKYYFDSEAIKEPAVSEKPAGNKRHKYADAYAAGESEEHRTKAGLLALTGVQWEKRNRRSVWSVATRPFKGAHFATFPPDLIEPCVLAGCPVGGVVLDPFGGAGTTGVVAAKHNRNAALIELNAEYVEIARARIAAAQSAKASEPPAQGGLFGEAA